MVVNTANVPTLFPNAPTGFAQYSTQYTGILQKHMLVCYEKGRQRRLIPVGLLSEIEPGYLTIGETTKQGKNLVKRDVRN